jgi:RsiW-degrading membrane proteinase PrsW (M82 family)
MQAPIPFVWWAVIEESIKFLLVALCILWRKAVDEPIDTMIYMLTMALGFSAFETALFLLEPLVRGDFITAITTQNLRFIGAGLLHTLASALVGFSLALTFYKHLFVRFLSLCCGLILAIFLHAEFNRHILQGTGGTMAIVFFFVWIGIVVLFILFEGAKRIHATKTQP